MAICILHLDGDSGFSASVKSLLQSEGMEIALTLVQSEGEFRKALEAGACDLILSGYSLPEHDGVSALKEARRLRPHIPFIVLSADTNDEAAIGFLRLGAADYLAKSDLRRLPSAVDRVLRISGEMKAQRKERDAALSGAATVEGISVPVPHADFRGLRILIAEDNAVNQVVIASLLEALGCDPPEVVGDGREALAAFRAKEFDIVFMDCQMPDLDGYAATIRIRRLEARGNGNRRCYIAAMTADIMPDVEEKCRAAGMDGQLAKPYFIEDLVETLERARQRAAAGGFHTARPPRTPGGDSGESGDIDIRILDRLRFLGGMESPSVFRDLVRGFLGKHLEKIVAIRELARTREYRTLAFAAHGLKGLCLNFGALSMARECETLQVAAEEERPGDLPRILNRLSAAGARTRTFLEGMIGAVAMHAGEAADAATPSATPGEGGSDG